MGDNQEPSGRRDSAGGSTLLDRESVTSTPAGLIPVEWDLPEEILARIGVSLTAQRALVAEGNALIILHHLPTPGIPERRGEVFWRNASGVWRSTTKQMDGKKALLFFLEEYSQRIDDLEEELPIADSASDLYLLSKSLLPIIRAVKHMLSVFQYCKNAFPHARDIAQFRDVVYELDRAVDLLYQESRTKFDYATAREVEEQSLISLQLARQGARLNILVAFFLPLSATAAFFGMNLQSGLEGRTVAWFWGILVFGTACGVALALSLIVHPKRISTLRRKRAFWFRTTPVQGPAPKSQIESASKIVNWPEERPAVPKLRVPVARRGLSAANATFVRTPTSVSSPRWIQVPAPRTEIPGPDTGGSVGGFGEPFEHVAGTAMMLPPAFVDVERLAAESESDVGGGIDSSTRTTVSSSSDE